MLVFCFYFHVLPHTALEKGFYHRKTWSNVSFTDNFSSLYGTKGCNVWVCSLKKKKSQTACVEQFHGLSEWSTHSQLAVQSSCSFLLCWVRRWNTAQTEAHTLFCWLPSRLLLSSGFAQCPLLPPCSTTFNNSLEVLWSLQDTSREVRHWNLRSRNHKKCTITYLQLTVLC